LPGLAFVGEVKIAVGAERYANGISAISTASICAPEKNGPRESIAAINASRPSINLSR
jgi:hypothetical protein